jgi:hypothetical protein
MNDTACIAELVPSGYKIAHVTCQGLSGGVAVIYKVPLKLTMLASSRNTNVTSFEYMDCNNTVKNVSLRLAVVYRPPRNPTALRLVHFLMMNSQHFLQNLQLLRPILLWWAMLIFTLTIFQTLTPQISKVSWKPAACDNTSLNKLM